MGNGKAKLRDNKTHERSIKNETKKNKNKRKQKSHVTKLKTNDNNVIKLEINEPKLIKSKGVRESEIPNYVEELDYFKTLELSMTQSMLNTQQKSINMSMDSTDLNGIEHLADYLQQKQIHKILITNDDNNNNNNATTNNDNNTNINHNDSNINSPSNDNNQLTPMSSFIIDPTSDDEGIINDLMIRKGTSNYSIGNQSFSNKFLAKSEQLTQDNIDRLKKLESIDVNNKLECTICASELKQNQKIGKLGCNHYFHKKCIYKWLKQNPTCPICRCNCVKFSSWL